MTLSDYGIFMISSIISIIMELLSYKKLSNNKNNKVDLIVVLTILIAAILVTINTYAVSSNIRAFVNITILFLCTIFVFRENFNKSLLLTIFYYVILTIIEIILAIIMSKLKVNLELFDNNIILKSIFSFVELVLAYIICSIKKVGVIADKIVNNYSNKKSIIVIFCVCLFGLIMADFKYIITVSNKIYYTNILLMISLISLLSISIYNSFRVTKEMEKTETLLNFITKYEETIDKNRINKHEMLNNLLMLKTFDDKNSIEFDNVLNDLIKEYDKSGGIKNIYKLPAGLKGMFYYKLNNIDDLNLNVNISKRIVDISKKISRKDYVVLCKTLGIVLDNAIEASLKSKEKYIGIEVYNNKNEYTIIIDNSCKDKVNLGKINNKNYSTKGKGRGLGLYILNNIINNSNCIKLIQSFDNMIFTSIIKVKIK